MALNRVAFSFALAWSAIPIVSSRRLVSSKPCDGIEAKIVLKPPGTYTTVKLTGAHLGNIEFEEYVARLSVTCHDGKPSLHEFHSDFFSERNTPLLDKPFEICTKSGQKIHLVPDVLEQLLPTLGDLSHRSRLGEGFCLQVSVDKPAPLLAPGAGLVLPGQSPINDLEKLYNKENVGKSPLTNLESYLYYIGGRSRAVIESIRHGTIYQELNQEYSKARKMNSTDEDEDLAELIDSDFERWHVLNDKNFKMPKMWRDGDFKAMAKDVLRQVMRRRLQQGRRQCWEDEEGVTTCRKERYAQAFMYIAGSLLAVVLEARAEQDELGIDPKEAVSPASAVYKLFSTYLDSEIGTFHVPEILMKRLPLEEKKIFGSHYDGTHTTIPQHPIINHIGSYIQSPKSPQPLDLTSQAFMDRLVMQWYSSLGFTGGNTYYSMDSARVFWRYFFKTLADSSGELGTSDDGSVELHRATLLKALSGPKVVIRQDRHKPLHLASFDAVLTEWTNGRVSDDPEAAAAIGKFHNGLKLSMQAKEGIASEVFAAGYKCASASAKLFLYQWFTFCRSSL